MTTAPRLALVDDASFDEHVAPRVHPERPERLAAARAGLRRVSEPGRILDIEARPATRDELARIHAPAYLERLEGVFARGFGQIDEDTYCSPGTEEAALRAAGGAVELVHALLEGRARRGLALLRPPGHHAEGDRAMGFCLLNNVAVAARAALAAGAERVAVVDWDVHHGNGTQHSFERSEQVLFASLHEWPLYPGTGAAREIGRGRGRGKTMNVALPSGSGDEVYGAAFRELVLPAIEAHRPDLILVSAGFDAHARDPLAAMELSEHAYGAMATALIRAADALGHGRVAFVLEGGYDLKALEASVAATVEAALGQETELPEGAISGRARRALERTRAAHSP